MNKVKREHSLVIGGTKGIGRSVVNLLASRQHRVSVISRQGSLKQIRSAAKADYWSADITNVKSATKALNNTIRKNGKLNHVVFCQRFRGPINAWNDELETTLTATKRIVEHLTARFDTYNASIVFVGSLSGSLVIKNASLAYHVAKAGLSQMAKYYAVLLGPKNIRVNCVIPGTILKEDSKHFFLRNKKLLAFYEKIIPLKRMGTANEVANVIAFLCSPESSFITGQNIVVDGGVSMQLQEELAARFAVKGFKSNA